MNSSSSVKILVSPEYFLSMNRSFHLLLFSFFTLLSTCPGFSQVAQQWSLGTPQYPEEIYGMSVTESGNILLGINEEIDSIGGSDIGIWRMDRSGNLLQRTVFGSEWDDFVRGFEKIGPNQYLLTGMRTTSVPFRQRATLYQIDSLGQVAWFWVNPDTTSISEFKIARMSDNGIIMACGNSSSPGEKIRSLVVSFDENGSVLNVFSKNDTVREISHAAWPMPDNTWIVAGDRQMPDLTYRPYLMKIDAMDSLYWRFTYDEMANGGAQNITGLADGNLVVVGESYAPGVFTFDIFLRKVDPNGQTIWYSTFGDSGSDAWFGVVESETDHSLSTTGYSFNSLSGNTDMILLHTDSSGNEIGREYAGLPGIDFGNNILQVDDTIWAAGFSIVGLDSQPLLVKHSWYSSTEGIGNQMMSDLRIFPSPVIPMGEVELEWENQKSSSLRILDITGRIISEIRMEAGQPPRFLAPSKEGIYLCQLLLDDKVLNFRLVVSP